MTKSSSSKLTALSPTSKDVLVLGRALVEELGPDTDVDTLSRWMAHYIAELIEAAESANDEDRPAKLAMCADAILKLWGHRHQLPNGKRPFEGLEPIIRALESLDPTDNTPRYFHTPRMAAAESEVNTEAKKWLDLADEVDYSARILIRYCLTQAAQTAIDKSKEWVALAEEVGVGNDRDISIVRIIINESNLLKENEPDDRVRRLLEDRVERLDAFKKIADALASDLRLQLKQLNVPKGMS
ncbi:MAG: hypothetical protein HY937_03740 [Nitrosomonadales bacterium]|nr:hypothetical protein [Nitrosomonadales bacterium]